MRQKAERIERISEGSKTHDKNDRVGRSCLAEGAALQRKEGSKKQNRLQVAKAQGKSLQQVQDYGPILTCRAA